MVLSVKQLTYRYPRSHQNALSELDFTVAEGEIFGFLGPNGSGKSTTQKILAGILPDYQGEVRVFGKDLRLLGAGYYNHIGVSFEFPNLYNKLTAEENLDFFRKFFDVPTLHPSELLSLFDLPAGDRRTVGQFSKGMRMRLVLARALVNNPRLLFLDEPTSGQDPEHSVLIREIIKRQRDQGTTVFLTTHNMSVADELCDRIALIVEGRIAVIDTPRNLKLAHGQKVVRVEYHSDEGLSREDFDLTDSSSKEKFIRLVRDCPVETIHTLEPSLEDVFLKVTGRRLKG